MDGSEGLGDVELEAEVGDDLAVAVGEEGEDIIEADALDDVGLAKVKEVGDLGVLLVALAGGGGHDVAALRIGLDNGLDLAELRGVGEGGAAELADFHAHGEKILAVARQPPNGPI